MDKEKIDKFITDKSSMVCESKPLIFDLQDEKDLLAFSQLISDGKIQCVIDDYREQQKEYFQVSNPTLVYSADFEKNLLEYFEGIEKDIPLWQHGRWVFFPWLSTISHILKEDAFQSVRTARNKNLINKDEQEKFYDAVVGIAGLSVGNSVALAIALQGGAKHIKLADHDSLSLSNTNRVRAGVENLGVLKVEVTARQIYTLNPYAQIDIFPEGLTKDNMGDFFDGLDIVIDELDNLAVKYLIREQARKYNIAVVMGADNGDNAVIDIERYDRDSDLEFFHGRMGNITYEELLKLDKFGIGKTITQHIGAENVTERMQQSLLEMGKTIVSWPQLGGAALLNGSAVAYCVRKILNNQPIESNRAIISLDEKLTPEYNSTEEIEKRNKASEEFKKIFGL